MHIVTEPMPFYLFIYSEGSVAPFHCFCQV